MPEKKDANKTKYNTVEVIKDVTFEEEVADERVKKEAIVKVPAKKQKKGLIERLVVGVIGPDGLPSIGEYLGKEIILPAVKNIIADSLTSGINMALFGDNAKRSPIRPQGPNTTHWAPNVPKTNYNARYSNPTAQVPQAYGRVASKRRNTVEEYVLSNRNEAVDVLDNLIEQSVAYGHVSVADYYDLIGVETTYTDNTYGWTPDELSTAIISPTRGGYIITLPTTSVL